MVADILRLRFDLLIGSLRGDAGRTVRTILSALVFIAATVAVCWALLSLADGDEEVARAVTVLTGSALTLGVTIGPAVGGMHDQLDPRRFAVFGLEPVPLAATLILAGFISLPSLAIIAIAACSALLWIDHGAPAALAWFAAFLAAVTCMLLARLSMAVSSLILRERRSREMTGLFILAIVVVVIPVAVFLGSLEWGGEVPSQLEAAVGILALTPFGAAWAIAPASVVGAGLASAITIAVITLAVTVLAWFGIVVHMLQSTERPTVRGGRGGLGWFAVMPGTAGGAIAARSLVYWMRDRRYMVNVVIVPIASIFAALPLMIAGVPPHIAALVPVPLMALFLGWIPHNDIAYDSTAIWLHIVSGVRGISDRLGRLMPITLIAVPLLAIAIPVSIALYGRWALLPAMVGVCANLFLAGLGLSSIASVLSPDPVTRPGDSPFPQPQRSGSGVGAQGLALLGAIVLSAPSLWFAWIAITRDIDAADTAMWVGMGVGAIVLIIGLVIGALLFERRGSQVMEFAEAV